MTALVLVIFLFGLTSHTHMSGSFTWFVQFPYAITLLLMQSTTSAGRWLTIGSRVPESYMLFIQEWRVRVKAK
jgi:hypothetical protein